MFIEMITMIPADLLGYHTTCKKMEGHGPFRLVYEQDVIMSLEYIVTRLRIVLITKMTDVDTFEEILY